MRLSRSLLPGLAFLAVSLLAALGCGGSTPPGNEPHEHEGGHEQLAGPLKDFHDVLAPLWHSDKGPDREKKTCAAMGTFEERAAAVKDEAITTAVAALKAECGKAEGARADFEAKFGAVHEAFHHAMEHGHKEH